MCYLLTLSLSINDDVIIVWSIDVARDPEFLGLMTYSKSSKRERMNYSKSSKRERTSSKSSKREMSYSKSSKRERGLLQNPARER